MSAEEDRLWNIVRANAVDFNAWTSLIEETEKVVQVCLHFLGFLINHFVIIPIFICFQFVIWFDEINS